MSYKKVLVFVGLFSIPIAFYWFLSLGKNQFNNLPVVNADIATISLLDVAQKPILLKGKVSLVCFPGNYSDSFQSGLLNLHELVGKKIYGHDDFQIVLVQPLGNEAKTAAFIKNLQSISDGDFLASWKFTYTPADSIAHFFESFGMPFSLDKNSGTPNVFILDKNADLRGRTDDEHRADKQLVAYDFRSPAILKQKLLDDFRVVLYEYRMAEKKPYLTKK